MAWCKSGEMQALSSLGRRPPPELPADQPHTNPTNNKSPINPATRLRINIQITRPANPAQPTRYVRPVLLLHPTALPALGVVRKARHLLLDRRRVARARVYGRGAAGAAEVGRWAAGTDSVDVSQ